MKLKLNGYFQCVNLNGRAGAKGAVRNYQGGRVANNAGRVIIFCALKKGVVTTFSAVLKGRVMIFQAIIWYEKFASKLL